MRTHNRSQLPFRVVAASAKPAMRNCANVPMAAKACLALAALSLCCGFGHAQQYGLTDLGTLGGSSSSAAGLNRDGQIVGSSATAAGATHAFFWDAAHGMIDLGTLSGSDSYGVAINNNGQVA